MIKGAINSLDGRYFDKTRALTPYFSEEALMRYRTLVECEFFIFLADSGITSLPKFSATQKNKIRSLYEKWSVASYKRIKAIEATTNHDVKAVEYFIKEKL